MPHEPTASQAKEIRRIQALGRGKLIATTTTGVRAYEFYITAVWADGNGKDVWYSCWNRVASHQEFTHYGMAGRFGLYASGYVLTPYEERRQ